MGRLNFDSAQFHRCTDLSMRNPRWHGVDPDQVHRLLTSGDLELRHIRALDEFLCFREEVEEYFRYGSDEMCVAILNFADANGGIKSLKFARKALLLLFEAEQIAGELAYAISQSSRRVNSAYPIRTFQGRTLKYSIAETDLPSSWRIALADMRDEFPGVDVAAPAKEVIRGVARSVRQLAKAALDADLQLALSQEVAVAYERSLLRRNPAISLNTIKKYLKDIMTFAAYLGGEQEFQLYIKERYKQSARRAHKASTRIDWKVVQIPEFRTVMRTAIEMLEEAKNTLSLPSAHALRNRAAAIAIIAPIPLRVADTTLIFGENIKWNGDAYHLFIPESSKCRTPFATTLHPILGRFVDHLILHERPLSHLHDARVECMQNGRALFVNRWGEATHRNYVSRCWWNLYGTGSHVARAKIHDEFGQLGPRGVALALAACGHRSEKSAEYYRSRAFDNYASEFVKEGLLAGVSEDEQIQYFS